MTESRDIPSAQDQALRDQIVERAKAAGLRLVRFLYCDNDSVIRGKATGMPGLARRLEAGIGLTVAMQAFSLLDRLAPVEGMGPVGEIRLVPDPATFVVAPYSVVTGVVLVDMMTLEGTPYAADGRGFLKRMVARAQRADLGIVAAFEPEWSLARPEGGDLPAPRREQLLLDRGHGLRCRCDRRRGRRPRGAGNGRGAALPRARLGPAGAVHRPRPGVAGRRQPHPVPGDGAGCCRAPHTRRLVRPEALARSGREWLPSALVGLEP
ncbi:MAG: glutamine synthetase [Actinomycetota bacterium]|nr:glutamine synthetase [Actinomycetota bacterium]